ncbi:hypothetical protein CPC08DRAFT_726680 [Agrocybe pediades]|nr:hypothetical protein CPC08DRAFT_726680 [Agrocybe pediades]
MAKKGRPPSSSYSINGPAGAVSINPAVSHPANASTANPKQARPDTTASSYINQSEYGYYDQRSEDVRFTSTEGGDGRSEDVHFEESVDDHMRFTQADERFGYGEQYSQEGGYGDEEESEDEDVFAFLPPTTAEQEEERRQAELAAAQQQQSHSQSQTHTFQQTSTMTTNTRTVAPKAEFAHSPFAFSASTPPPASANDNATNNNRYSSNNPYTMFGYSPHNAYDNNDGYSSQEDIRPTTAAGRPTTSAGLRGLGVMQSHPSLVSAPSFSFSVAGSVSTAGGNGIGLAPALPITSTSTMPNANASSPGVAYPDPTFDPWGRSSAALASPGRASNNPYYSTTNVGPRPDTAYSYTTNPYSIPNRSTAVAAGSGIRYPHPPPLSPPSPSTDSHPSTAGGLSQLAAGGAGPNAPEQFKLRRLNTGAAAPASGPPKSGLREETERDVVDGQAVEAEEDEEVGVEEVEVGAGAAAAATRLGGGKAVRVSLPGVVAPSRKSASIGRRSTSVHDNGKRESRDSDTLADADLGEGKDLDGDVLDSPIKPFSGVADAAQVVKRRHNHHNSKARHSSKRYSTVPGTPLTPHTPGTPGGPSSAGGAGFGYSTAVAGVNGAGQGYKTKNPNAQPYYAYAGLARDGGYPYPASSSHAQSENGGVTASGSGAAAISAVANARAVMTAANTSANGGYGISKESRKKRRSGGRKKSHRMSAADADADSMKGGDLDLERGDASSIVKAGVVGDEDEHDEGLHQYEEYGYENGKRSSRRRRRKDKDRAMEEDRDSLASVSTRASGSVLPHDQSHSHSHSRSRSRSRPRTYATTTEEGGYEGDYGSAEYVGGQPYGKGYPYGSGERGPYGRGDGDGGYDGDEGSTTRDSAYWEEGSESESEESIK